MDAPESFDWESLFRFLDRDIYPPVSRTITPSLPQEGAPGVPVGKKSGNPAHTASSSESLDISSTFSPAALFDHLPPDLTLISADEIHFYVHSQILLNASTNDFCSLLPISSPSSRSAAETQDTILMVSTLTDREVFIDEDDEQSYSILAMPQQSAVLNVILHAIYDLSCAQYSPTIDTLVAAVEEMPNLGLQLRRFISPSTSLFQLLLSNAPLFPLQLYALAAQFDLPDLATPVSSHLLSFSLSQLDDGMAERIGVVYLKRLFLMHIGRMEALKRILLQPPRPHAPNRSCSFENQHKLTRAWALASAYLVWDATPDMPTTSFESALIPHLQDLACDLCRQILQEKMRNLVVQWSVMRRTI